MRPACEALLQKRKACFLALAETIGLDPAGKWAATPEATQQLAAFRQMVIPQAKNSNGMAFFATPANATWADIRIKFIDGETVSVKVGDVTARLPCSEMGMVVGRTRRPNKQWELLRSFAKGYGVMTWESPDADPRNQKRREYLARDLKAFFRIDGEPIVLTDDKKGWRTVLSIESDG